jgi:light-regulated signal transduction histidine kinase (bacteriophytochrome)
MNAGVLNPSLENLQEAIRLLQEELARTNQEVLVLTLELETRVENRTAELRATQGQLQRANAELLQLTAQLEDRVLQRTRELEQANHSLLQEIKERKEAEAKLQLANESLRRANADLEQFAYSASHDLQEPLRMVSIYSQMLQKKYGSNLDAKAHQYISYTVEGATRMERLIADLLTYTGLTSTPEASAMFVDANKPLLWAISNLRETMEQNAAVITRTVLPRVPMQAVHLQQVFQNLLGNAIKFRGREPPRIEIDASRRGCEWLFSVKDNGIGIDGGYANHIFGIFKRLHSAAEYSGTGMGLAICKRIVECYSGRIWVESKLGDGATFFFTIRDEASNEPPSR